MILTIQTSTGLKVEPAHVQKIKQLAQYCPRDCAFYNGGIENLCKVKDVGLKGFVECLEENPSACDCSLPYAYSWYCSCPARVYIAKVLKMQPVQSYPKKRSLGSVAKNDVVSNTKLRLTGHPCNAGLRSHPYRAIGFSSPPSSTYGLEKEKEGSLVACLFCPFCMLPASPFFLGFLH